MLACGANHSYFGHDEWEEHAPGLKTLEQATEIRRRILLAFELAEREPAKQREHLTMLVVGGGPTGVELAGAVGEISRYTLAKDFRRIDPAATRIILIEAAGRRLARGAVLERPLLSSWSAVLDYCRTTMAFAAREEFRVLFLDRRNHLIADEVQGRGTVDHTPVYPREVARRALELSATAIILVHNHPTH